ncbi:hypothetical protein ACFFRR_000494 [Megaselia abdita]
MIIKNLVYFLLISWTVSFDCEKSANELEESSLKTIFLKECQESSNWSVNSTFKQKVWHDCIKELSMSSYSECLSFNTVLFPDVIRFYLCYELKVAVSEGNLEEGYEYNMFRVARCISPDTQQSVSESFDFVSNCMLSIKDKVGATIQVLEYEAFWDCITLQFWFNGHGWKPPTKEESDQAKSDCRISSGITNSVYENLRETKTYSKEMIPYINCILKKEGVMENECILIDRSWQKFQDLDKTEVIYTLRNCYKKAAGETSLDHVKYFNCVSGKLGRVYV